MLDTTIIWIHTNTVPVKMPISELWWSPKDSIPTQPPPKINARAPDNYCCFNCAWNECQKVECENSNTLEIPRTPKDSYMELVKFIRAAATKREEECQDKLQAERDATAGAKSPKKEKATESPKAKSKL